MATKTKAFDAVAMKDRIQADLMAEYAARKREFKSLTAFLESKARTSPWARAMTKRFARRRPRVMDADRR
jgi:hypothetical protein